MTEALIKTPSGNMFSVSSLLDIQHFIWSILINLACGTWYYCPRSVIKQQWCLWTQLEDRRAGLLTHMSVQGKRILV